MSQAMESAIRVTEDYISSLDAFGNWYGYDFDEVSYSKTAAAEILDLLKKNMSVPPLCVIEDFRNKMGKLSFLNEHTKDIFAVAYVTAENIIDILIT